MLLLNLCVRINEVSFRNSMKAIEEMNHTKNEGILARLPVPHSGGVIVVERGQDEIHFDLGSSLLLSEGERHSFQCSWVAFCKDTHVTMHPVTAGCRVTVTWQLYLHSLLDDSPLTDTQRTLMSVDPIYQALDVCVQDVYLQSLELQHRSSNYQHPLWAYECSHVYPFALGAPFLNVAQMLRGKSPLW